MILYFPSWWVVEDVFFYFRDHGLTGAWRKMPYIGCRGGRICVEVEL